VVEQAAQVPSSRGRVRELLRNSLRSFSDPDAVSQKMQLGPLELEEGRGKRVFRLTSVEDLDSFPTRPDL
jgi:hypothetical protein